MFFTGSERFPRESLRPCEFSDHGVKIGCRDLRDVSDVWIPLSSLKDSAHVLLTLAGAISVPGYPCVETSVRKGCHHHHHRPTPGLQEVRRFDKRASSCEMVLGRDEIAEVETSHKRCLMCES